MSRKPGKPEIATVIKWTEDEWRAVAAQLLRMHGPSLLSSPALDEIKAKDVFIAQDVLPETRHRKLISISQGFATNRLRLHKLLQQIKPAPANGRERINRQGKQASKSAPPVRSDTVDDRRHVATSGVSKSARNMGASSRPTGEADVQKTSSVQTSEGYKEKTRSAASGQAHSASAEIQGERRQGDEPLPIAATAETALSNPELDAGPQTEPAPQTTVAGRHHPRANLHAQVQRGAGNSSAETSKHDATGKNDSRTVTAQPSANLVELARPFVAMVCQELATALVSALSRHANAQDLTATLQTLLSGKTATQAAAPDEHQEQAPRQFRKDNRQEQPSTEDDKGHPGESDVQPLFDPKLPPSPNSPFKPLIGLIGAGTRDFEDLQQFYPQLQLTVVSAEAVRSTPVLRDCQRMLGMREDISAESDEFLRRAFGNRYLRVSGGIERIREQLDAWLNNPGAINAAPGRSRKPFNGKGKGGDAPKNRRNRRPGPGRP